MVVGQHERADHLFDCADRGGVAGDRVRVAAVDLAPRLAQQLPGGLGSGSCGRARARRRRWVDPPDEHHRGGRPVHLVGRAGVVEQPVELRGRPDHLDQQAEGHLGAARTTPTAHRALRAATHPRRPTRHPDRPGWQRDSRGPVAHHPGPSLRWHRRRADHRSGLLVVRIISQPNRTGHSGPRRQAAHPRSGHRAQDFRLLTFQEWLTTSPNASYFGEPGRRRVRPD